MNKPHICFVQTSVYPLINPKCRAGFGGSEVQIQMIGKQLAKNSKTKISFLVGNYGQPHIEKYDNFTVYRGITPSSNPLIKFLQAFKLFYHLTKIGADIYVQRTANMGTGLIAIYTKIFKKKFVYMVASNIDVNCQEKNILGNFGSFFYRLGIKYTNLIIAQSKNQQLNLKQKFNKDSIILKSLYHIPKLRSVPQKKYILWVGRSDHVKKPELFIKLAKKNPQIPFRLICQLANDSQYHKAIKQQAEQVDNLKLIEYVPFNQIDRYFKTAKILINTSDFEGFPNTFIQAPKNYTPIISLNSNPDNILHKYNFGYCTEGNQDKLNDMIHKILKNKNLFNELSRNAYLYAIKNHSLEKNISIIEKALLKLTN